MKQPHCIHCGEDGHYQAFCRFKPRKPIPTKVLPKARRPKPISKAGKHAYLWKQARLRWLSENSPDTACHYCGTILTLETLTLDHKIPRSRQPSARYRQSNLVPCCFNCNGLKGSVGHDEYPHDCPDLQQVAA